LMKQVEHRAQHGWNSLLTALELLGLPMRIALRALPLRVQTRACYAAPLLLVRPDWEARLNSVQDRWVTRLLDLEQPAPRIQLLRELGFPLRLATSILLAAIGLAARIEATLPDSQPAQVAAVAMSVPSSWLATVHRHLSDLALPSYPTWAERDHGLIPGTWATREHGLIAGELTAAQRKRGVARYLDTVARPALLNREMAWREREAFRHPQRGLQATAAIAAGTAAPPSAIRAWAQFRIQGRLTSRRGAGTAKCARCGIGMLRDGVHPLESCPQAEAAAREVAAGTPWVGRPPRAVLAALRAGEDAEACMAVAAALAREAQAAPELRAAV